MTEEVHRTLIVPAALAEVARAIASALSPAGAGMFVSGLNAAGGPVDAEPTHYVSTGKIKAQFAELLESGNATAMHASAQVGAAAQGLPVTWTDADCAELLIDSDVSHEQPFYAFARLGLQLVQPEEL